jgi:hypothetical protein
MGGHFSFHMRLTGIATPTTALHGLLSLTHFSPASLGAIEGHENGDHWFLSGYALEDFAGRFIQSMPAKPASVELVPSLDSANSKYLRNVSEAVVNRRDLPALSSFEEVNESAAITFLDNIKITENEIDRYAQWTRVYPGAVGYIYGAIDLSSSESRSTRPWRRAFREIIESPMKVGSPFLLLRVGRAPVVESQLEVALFSWSALLLEQGSLDRLVAILDAIFEPCRERLASSWLTLEGSAFKGRESSLANALSAFTVRRD